MCGIAGLIHHEPEPKIASMLKTIEHRGRDDEGVWLSEKMGADGQKVCFGHRRLSIIDTSTAGHQPFVSADGRFVLTFNGEIYNYKILKAELEERGYKFQTDCDTEVLINAFAEWQTDCLARLNGMFAFAIWDERDKTLTLARDRAGIKPVYFARKPGLFAFSSEIKAILSTGLFKAEIDAEALNQYLTFLWTPDPLTLFKNIFKLPAGHFLVWRNGEIKIQEWWDVSFDRIETNKTENEWREEILATLEGVVKMEMVADVPLGSFLSGGVDSSSIVALMNKHGGERKISTYTVGFSSEDLRYDIVPDDVAWARKVGKLLDTDYHETILQPAVADLLPKLVWQMDEPVADPAIFASYLISKAAREKLTVLLSGVGGDEIFAGYPRQLAMRFAGFFDFLPQGIRSPFFKTIERAVPGGLPGRFTAPLRNAKKFSRSAALDFENRYLGFGTYFTDAAKQKLYSKDLREATKDFDAHAEHRKHFARVQNAAPLNRLLYVDFKTFLPNLNLAYTDKTSMAATLEVRVPFLNVELVELAARIPPELKLKGFERKYIFKRAAENLLPKDVVRRKKAGFGAPVRSWLRGALKPLVEDLLSEETVKKRGLFEPREVRRVIDENLSGREDFNLQVFQLLVLELWQQTFVDI